MLKKVLSLAAFVAMLTVSSYAQQTPVKLSLYDQIAWPNKAETSNAVLGLIDSNTPTVYGIDWNFISARAEVMHGYQAAFMYNRANEMMGLQKAIYTLADEASGVQLSLLAVSDIMYGVQIGFLNISKDNLQGVQIGAANFAQNASGVQVGLYNQAESFSGLQFGIVNRIINIESGLQIGLVNLIENNGHFPGMILVNGRF